MKKINMEFVGPAPATDLEIRFSTADFRSEDYPNSFGGVMIPILGENRVTMEKEPPSRGAAGEEVHSLVAHFTSADTVSRVLNRLNERGDIELTPSVREIAQEARERVARSVAKSA